MLSNDNKFLIQKCDNLEQAFSVALKNSKPNDTILLSPATASYDQYANYIERGKHFDNLVKNYIESNKLKHEI